MHQVRSSSRASHKAMILGVLLALPSTARAASNEEPRSSLTSSGEVRSYALVPAIAGGTFLVAGGVSWAISRGELNKLRSDDPRIATRADMERSVSRGQTWQTVGVSLLGLGVAGLATAAGMYVLGGPDQPVTIGIGTNGKSAFVHGRWP